VNAIATCSTGRFQQRLLSAPPITWLALLAAAHWTHWRWAAARLSDGSDDPLGLAAVLVLVWALLRHAGELRAQPRPLWLGVSMALSVTATAAVWWLPPLIGALLALPLVSSMQFYAGYPLRVVTAELSTWGLRALGFVAERTGSAMQVDGQLIIVDAPCSGVQMVWMAYFCACTMALWRDLRDAQFLRRLPFIGLLVLLGNVLRNTVLVGLQASHVELTEWAHQGVGLAVLALVCAAVCGLMAVRPPQAAPTTPAIRGLYGLD
jgi:exosortase/archaeosortase family protein